MEKTPVTELTDAQLGDEYAETRLRMMAWRPNVNPDEPRFCELTHELLARQEKQAADKQVIVEGEKWKVPISPRDNKTTITDAMAVYKVVRKLGLEKVLEVYKITLSDVKKFLSQKQQDKFLKTDRTGPREIQEPVLKQARQ